MNFALLGEDPLLLPLIAAIADHPQHALTHVALADATLTEIMQRSPSTRVVGSWDELLPIDSLDAVLIGGQHEDVLTGAKQLAAHGRRLLVLPAAGQGPTFVYELTLIRDETHVPLYPILPVLLHPQFKRLRKIIDAGSLGTILHLQLERELQQTEGANMLAVADVDTALLPDVALLRHLGGDYNQVTALRSGTTADGLLLATVTLAGDRSPEASWSLKATPSSSVWQLRVTGEQGRVTLCGCDDPSQLRLTTDIAMTPADSETVEEGTNDFDTGRALLEQFEAAEKGSAVHPNWTDLTRTFETVDATHRSIRRRRTIDLHFETTSERSLFKTQMTAIGCGILTLTLMAVVLVLVVGTLFKPGEAFMRIARIAVFLPLFLFLLLQLLIMIARPSSTDSDGEEDSARAK